MIAKHFLAIVAHASLDSACHEAALFNESTVAVWQQFFISQTLRKAQGDFPGIEVGHLFSTSFSSGYGATPKARPEIPDSQVVALLGLTQQKFRLSETCSRNCWVQVQGLWGYKTAPACSPLQSCIHFRWWASEADLLKDKSEIYISSMDLHEQCRRMESRIFCRFSATRCCLLRVSQNGQAGLRVDGSQPHLWEASPAKQTARGSGIIASSYRNLVQ